MAKSKCHREIAIRHDIPVPLDGDPRINHAWPFDMLPVGASFDVAPRHDQTISCLLTAARQAILRNTYRTPHMHFSARAVRVDGKDVVRCWRTS